MALQPTLVPGIEKKPQGGMGPIGALIAGITGAAALLTGGAAAPALEGVGALTSVAGMAKPGKPGSMEQSPQVNLLETSTVNSIKNKYSQPLDSGITRSALEALSQVPKEAQELYREPLEKAHAMALYRTHFNQA